MKAQRQHSGGERAHHCLALINHPGMSESGILLIL